ncbi:MAG: hypothetical protein ACJ74W_24090 [Pyrinomonadaceae bacterium]
MFSTVLQELKGYFSRDFFLTVFFPIMLFTGLSVTLCLEISYGLRGALAAWEKLALQTQGIAILCWLVVVTTLSYMVYNYLYAITRLFEGYWTRVPILWRLRNPRVNLHKQRWKYLGELAEAAGTVTLANEIIAEQLAYYPPSKHLDKMMPTLFGNIMRTSEIYAYDRYGIDSTITWTRLRPLLKIEALAALEDKKISLNFSILMTFFFASFSLFWCTTLAAFTTRWGLFLLCAAGWPFAWFSYRNAIQSALAYSEQVAAVFDLYRHDLLKALNRKVPPDISAERKEWLRLTRFFYRNAPLSPAPPSPERPDGWERLADVLAGYLERSTTSTPASAAPPTKPDYE